MGVARRGGGDDHRGIHLPWDHGLAPQPWPGGCGIRPQSAGFAHDPEATLSPECTPAIDHRRRFGRDVVGVREYEGRLVAVIAVDEKTDAPSGRHHHEVATSGALQVAAVAAGLRQFDVRLDAIDIVSVRKRHVSEEADPCRRPTTIAPRMSSTARGWCYGWIRSECRGGGDP